MKSQWVVFISFILLLTMWRFYRQEQRQIPVISTQMNAQFTVSLPSNRTTGYSWQLISYDKEYVELQQHEYKQADQQLVGAPGVDEFVFRALKLGTTYISLEYKRPWEKEVPAAKKEKVRVIISE